MTSQKLLARAYRFFGELTPIMGLYAVYFASRGTSESTISLLFFIWSATVVLFELPSSIYADLFSRKQVLVLSQFFKLLCMTLWIISPNTIGFLLGFIAWGIATALNSGTFQAYLHDTVTKDKKDFKNELSVSYYASISGGLIAFMVGFFVLKYGGTYQNILVIGAASMSISLMCALLLKKDTSRRNEDDYEESILKLHIKQVRSSLKGKKLLIAVLITGALLGSLKGGLEEYHSLLLSKGGFTGASISLFFLCLSVAALVGTHIVNKNSFSIGKNIPMIFAVGIVMMLAPFVGPWVAAGALVLMNVIDSILRVNLEVALHDMTESKIRASVASTSGAIMELGSLLLFITSAAVLKFYNLNYIYYLAGVFVVALALYYSSKMAEAK